MSGINQIIDNMKDAYRGNPDALAQKYQQSEQQPNQEGNLIELMALQQLTSEKEAAVRAMQLKMSGKETPTVGQALGNKALELTKQQLAQNTAGTMQNKQNQEQQATKQLVQQASQAPTQSPSRTSARSTASRPARSPRCSAASGTGSRSPAAR